MIINDLGQPKDWQPKEVEELIDKYWEQLENICIEFAQYGREFNLMFGWWQLRMTAITKPKIKIK